MSCREIQGQLTAYLEGELEDQRGSVVRGHLRACEACRQAASDEAKVRDGLRSLPPIDPPASLWAGVQARLAAAEIADAERPAWKRALARWAPKAPTFAMGGLAAAAVVTLVVWRAHRTPVDEAPPPPIVAVSPARPVVPPPVPDHVATPAAPTPDSDDVTADLGRDAERRSASYAQAADELVALATEARAQWSDEQKAAFDAKVGELRAVVGHVAEGRPRQRAWRELIRYLQGAVIRDDVALAGGAR